MFLSDDRAEKQANFVHNWFQLYDTHLRRWSVSEIHTASKRCRDSAITNTGIRSHERDFNDNIEGQIARTAISDSLWGTNSPSCASDAANYWLIIIEMVEMERNEFDLKNHTSISCFLATLDLIYYDFTSDRNNSVGFTACFF